MPKFAVYYIPPAESPFYQFGSGLLGYDIRAGAALPHNNPARDRLTGFDPAWVDRAAEYGFHVTVAGTYTCDPADLDAVRAGVAAVMDCFNPAHAFTLRPMALEWWGDPAAVLLVCTPNSHFQMLHTALCAYLPRWGTGSRGFDRLARDSGYLADQSHAQRRIRHFYTAYIFDEFHAAQPVPRRRPRPPARRDPRADGRNRDRVAVPGVSGGRWRTLSHHPRISPR